jgi:hypothetical protein
MPKEHVTNLSKAKRISASNFKIQCILTIQLSLLLHTSTNGRQVQQIMNDKEELMQTMQCWQTVTTEAAAA